MGSIVTLGPQSPALQATQSLQKYRTAVYIKERWADDWAFFRLIPQTAALRAWPARSQATFLIDLGEIKYEDVASFFFRRHRHEQVHDYYVAIQVVPEAGTPYCLWCGYIPAQNVNIAGTKLDGADPVWSGQIAVTAYGLDTLLERRVIQGAYVRKDASTIQQIGWGPTFNRRLPGGQQPMGNRSTDPIAFGSLVYPFGEGGVWTAADIVQYLLYYSQLDIATQDEPHFQLAGPQDIIGPDGYLASLVGVIEHEGQSLKKILGRLLDRRRGLGVIMRWGVEGDEESDNFGLPVGDLELDVRSLVSDPVEIGAISLPANVDTVTLDFETDLSVDRASLVFDTIARYDQVIVQGERVRTCFSVTTEDGFNPGETLARIEPAWTEAQETAYEAATDLERKSEIFDRVYRAFRIPADFDWRETLGANGLILSPSFDDDGVIDWTTSAPAWNRFHRILRELPFLENADVQAEIDEARYAKPFAILLTFGADGPASRWVYAHHKPTDDAPIAYHAANVVPSDREMLVEVRFAPNHVLGRQHFDASDPGTEDSEQLPVFDYDRMVITLAVECDNRPTVLRRLMPLPLGISSRKLVLTIPDAHVWCVAAGTIIGLYEDGSFRIHQEPGAVRDDTERLRQIAAAAFTHYTQARNALEVAYHGLLQLAQLGTMIDTARVYYEDRPIKTVVTEHSWDFSRGTTTLKTGHVELDFGGFR